MREIASAIIDCPIPFHGNRKERLVRFYREIAGVGLVFPRADHPIAVEFPGYPVVRLRHIAGIRYVEEAVTALGSVDRARRPPVPGVLGGGNGQRG
jgi:hypothetical protein